MFHRSNRREFIAGAAVAAAGLVLPRTTSLVQAQATKPRRVDVHHHLISPAWKAQLKKWQGLGRNIQGYETHQSYDPAKDIESMDMGEVEISYLSVTTPGMWFGDIDETRRVVRAQNEYGAQLVQHYKGRFGHFATVPLPDVEASLREIEYALDTLKADGISFVTSYADRWLGDKAFAPMWEELNRRKAVVYTHATAPNCCMWNFQESIGGPIPLEFNSDLARTIASVISSGVAAKTPDVTYIWSHGGGSIWAQRYINAQDLANPTDPKSKMYHLRRFFYDTASANDSLHIGILKLAVPTSQILFGTDYPWGNAGNIAAGLSKANLSAAELRAIDRENALKIW